MRFIILLLLFPVTLLAQPFTTTEKQRWQEQANRVTIIRDNWGIAHVYGKTDADAVFGLLYAQCEDDFKRVELNYIEKLGRMAEIKGEAALYSDLYIRLLIDSADAVKDYNNAPQWFKLLLNAYADGINYYRYKHPQVQPLLIQRFKPWFPLLWTDGSIGAINTADITVSDVKAFYENPQPVASTAPPFVKETADGSNGFAFAPAITENGNAILYINPHTTFYFRPEIHINSEEGLNSYGAVTWGQFFIYQGFNEHCGWMHTSSNADVADVYLEKITKQKNRYYYQYNQKQQPVTNKKITLAYKSNSGVIVQKQVTAFYTHHGPVMGLRNGQWATVKSYNRSMKGLLQSWLRNKANSFEGYKKIMELRGNTSNNTVYADSKGNIAYWHGNYMPVRDTTINWSLPVDGTTKATDWKGLHTVNETVHIYNPVNGWLQNCNSTPFTAAGVNSPSKKSYPAYMAPDGENFRGINAVRVLGGQNKFTIDKVITAGYNRYLTAFEVLVPALQKAFSSITKDDSLYEKLVEPVATLTNWNFECSENSVATALAVEWAERLTKSIQQVYINQGETDQVQKTKQFVAIATPQQLLQPLNEVVTTLQTKFGSWLIPWGQLNRYQRLTGNITESYNDAQPSMPVGFTASTWGCLPSFVSSYMPGTQKRYGASGNSFVCVVEFGKKVKAKSVLAGGVNSVPAAAAFSNQAQAYTQGSFKDILFYKEEVLRNAVTTYKPGEE